MAKERAKTERQKAEEAVAKNMYKRFSPKELKENRKKFKDKLKKGKK